MSSTENDYVATDLGNIALNPRGEYEKSASYEYLDTVSYQGGSYMCLAELTKTVTGIAPEAGKNTEAWQLLTLPGDMTPEYIAAHDEVVNKAKQVETSRAAVELSQQEVEAAQADVTQMWQDTQEASQTAIASRDSAAGYAQSAEASRTAAKESEDNINAQVTGFDTHVAEKTSAAESAIIEARRAAVSAVSTKQDNVTQAVTDEGDKQIKKVEDAGTEQVGKAKSAGASAVSAAGAAGVSAVNAVKTQQTASIKAIQEAGENALQNISDGVDDTFTQKGKAADSEAVGKALSNFIEKYNGMIQYEQGIIDGYDIKYNDSRVACRNLPSNWDTIKAVDGYDITMVVFDESNNILSYDSNPPFSNRVISKQQLKKLCPSYYEAWLQIRKTDNSVFKYYQAVGSIEITKSISNNSDYINAIDYGFYNYGEIANDSIMKEFLENDSDKELYFPKGTYMFKEKIEVTNGCKIRMDNEAELKLDERIGNIGEHFFIFGDTSDDKKRGCYINGGIINANFCTDTVVCLDSIQSAKIENSILKNANKYGVQTGRTQERRASDFYMRSCRILNEKYVSGATGIYDNAYDNSFDNVTIVDFPIGIETASSKFNRVHMWLSSATFIPNSIGIILDNNPSCFTNCTIDTYQRGVISRGMQHYEFNSTNLTFFLNTNVYTKKIAESNPPVVFHKIVMSESFTSVPILHCHGITINKTDFDIMLVDFEYTAEQLKNVWCSGVTKNQYIKNTSFLFSESDLEDLKGKIDAKITKFYAGNQGETHLEDSDNGSIQDMVLYGKSEQTQYKGKNLLPTSMYSENTEINGVSFTVNKNGSVTVNGTATDITYFSLWGYNVLGDKGLLPGIKFGDTIYVSDCLLQQTNSETIISSVSNRSTTMYESTTTMYVAIKVSKGETVKKTFYPQIELGSEFTSYEPYVGGVPSPNLDYPQEIKSVVNPVMKVCGKNLYDSQKYPVVNNRAINADTGNICASQSGNYCAVEKYIPFPYGGKRISHNNSMSLCAYDENYNFLSSIPTRKIVPDGTMYVRFDIKTIDKDKAQIELSETITDYESYKENSFSLPYTLNAIPVRANGNITINEQQYIADYVDVENGKIVRCVGDTLIDNNSKLNNLSITATQCRAFANVDNCLPFNNLSKDECIMCDQLIASDNGLTNSGEQGIHRIGTGASQICISFGINSGITTMTEFTNRLKENPLHVLYPLENPTEINLTSEEIEALKRLSTYYPITNYSVSSEQLAGYTVFNYPISMEAGWNYVKQQINDNRDYIYDIDSKTQDIDTQSAEAYVNSEYAVTLTELGV